jgi:arginine-tRNA-protein transferase
MEWESVTREPRDAPQFYLTAPSPCPYLPGMEERKVFTHLVGRRATALNDMLTQTGFRRSQTIAYRPACEQCRACVSVRVLVEDFRPSANLRRIANRNSDLIGATGAAKPTAEQYSLFRAYLDQRHPDGGMADMSVLDYSMMVEDSHIESRIIEYRRKGPDHFITHRGQGRLYGACLTDQLADGLSMVYSFFEPDYAARSLGTFMVLDHIERAKQMGLPFVYLGYWVRGSRKMDYKSRFLPQERLSPEGWIRVE